MRSDRDEIKQALKDRIEDVCRALLPDGQRRGRLWVAHNPVMLDHAQTPEFKVALDRDVGAWRCWRASESGDVIRLVEYCLATDFRGAMDWARDFLGMKRMSQRERKDFAARNAERRRDVERQEMDRIAARLAAVRRLWDSCASIDLDLAGGTVARRYLAEGRGCPIERVPNLDPKTFRAHGALEWWSGRKGRAAGPTRTISRSSSASAATQSSFPAAARRCDAEAKASGSNTAFIPSAMSQRVSCRRSGTRWPRSQARISSAPTPTRRPSAWSGMPSPSRRSAR